MAKNSKRKTGERLAAVRAIIEEDDFKTAKKDLLGIIKDIPHDISHTPSLIDAYLLLADALIALGDFKGAIEQVQKAIISASAMGDDPLLARAMLKHGHILIRTSEYDKAKNAVMKSLDISRSLKDDGLEGLARIELANLIYLEGDADKAEAELRDSILLLERVGDKKGIARAYNNIATFIYSKGDKERALEFFEKARVMSKKAGAVRNTGLAMMNKAEVLVELERPDEAEKEALEALRIFEERGDRFLVAKTYMVFGMIHAERAEWGKAEDMLHKARLLVKKIGMPSTAGSMLFEIGKVYVRKGERERGFRHIEEARAIFKEYNSVHGLQMLDEYLERLGKES